MSSTDCIELQTNDHVSASVIWLHGLGADGSDFVPVVKELNLPVDLGIRFIFPNAPQIPVTVNGGYIMPAWYDILELTEERVIDHNHLLASIRNTQALIDREIERGIPSDRIVLAGFSQGGAVAYHAALDYAKPLAGLLALSTYLPKTDNVEFHQSNKDIPILICHGIQDPMVVERQGKRAASTLEAHGYQFEYKSYHMEHELCIEEVRDISLFLQKCLAG